MFASFRELRYLQDWEFWRSEEPSRLDFCDVVVLQSKHSNLGSIVEFDNE